MEYIIITLLQTVRRVCQWKNFKNWSLIGEDTNKSKVPRFSWPTLCNTLYRQSMWWQRYKKCSTKNESKQHVLPTLVGPVARFMIRVGFAWTTARNGWPSCCLSNHCTPNIKWTFIIINSVVSCRNSYILAMRKVTLSLKWQNLPASWWRFAANNITIMHATTFSMISITYRQTDC